MHGNPIHAPWRRAARRGGAALAALSVVASGAVMATGGMTAQAAPKPAAPTATASGVSFTLEGCRNDGSITLPIAGKFVCPDAAYTSGNLGKGWAELDLVPYRLTANAGNSAPATQNYTIAYAVDREDGGAAGYDVLSTAVVNTDLSKGTCPAPDISDEQFAMPGIGGIDKTLYREITIAQMRNATCVYDFYARLALGSHLFPGASLHANLAVRNGTSLDTGGVGARDVSIPVRELAPQELRKDMGASRGSNHTWNVTKEVTPTRIAITDTCEVEGEAATASLDETITWTKSAAIPGMTTVTTNIYAKNPASRPIQVSVKDVIYAGDDTSTPLDDTTFPTITLAPGAEALVGTHRFVWDDSTTSSFNDVATATYVDAATGIAIPGSTQATASAEVQDNGPVTNGSAVITDTQSIAGDGLSFSVDEVLGATGGFGSYVLGAPTSSPITWTSDSQTDSGSVTFRKTLYAARGTIEPDGSLSDEATVTGSDGFTTSATASAAVMVDTRASLTITKTIPDGVLTTGAESAKFTFTVTNGDDSRTVTIPFAAGETTQTVTVEDLTPGVYTVSEQPAPGWEPVAAQEVDLNGATCSATAEFANTATPVTVTAQKVTVPAGFEAGWEMGLYAGDDTTPIAIGTTDDSGLIDFGPIGVEGSYQIREVDQEGWTGSAADECTFEVELPAAGGSTFTCTMTNTFEPTVTLDKTGDDLSKVGDEVTYALTVENTSPQGATAGTPDISCRVTDPQIGFDETARLIAGASKTWSDLGFTIPAEGADPYVNAAAAECTFVGEADVVATADASWSTELFQPEVTVVKEADRPFAQVGDTVTYTVTITNSGSTDSPALVPDATNPFTDPLAPGVTLPADCDEIAVGDTCQVKYDYVVTAADTTIPNTASVLFHPKGFPNDVRGSDSASVTVIRPAFTVTKTCTTPTFPAGSTVIFAVEVRNTGDVPLRMALDDSITTGGGQSAVVLTGSNTTATIDSDVTNADITFVSGQARFRIEPGELAQLEVSVGAQTGAVRNDIATTGRLTSDHPGTTYAQTLTAQDVCNEAPPQGATRTIGFWRTHLDFTKQVVATRLPIKLSASGTYFTLSSINDVMGIFWANNAQDSTGKKRSTICQARITMAKQLLGAILNQSFSNAKPLPQVGGMDLITAALTAMDGKDAALIRSISMMLDDYNNSGDETSIVIPGNISIGKASPTDSRTNANLKIGDC